MFLPTASMANQIALRILTRPGDEVLAEENSHVFINEQGGPAVFSGLVMRGLPGHHGRIAAEQVRAAMRDWRSGHMPITRLVSIEDTHNSAGGRVWPLDEIDAIVATARELDLRVHLDGARIVNAATALGVPAAEIGRRTDTVTLCLSKGLGCPLGALVAGSAELMVAARRAKHLFGGAMRQAGIVAAAGVYALDHNVERIADDHARARRLGDAWAAAGLGVDPEQVETNFVFLDVGAARSDAGGRRRRGSRTPACGSPTRCTRRSSARSRISGSRTRTSSARRSSCRRRSGRRVSTPEPLAAELERLVRREQRDKRLPSVAAAVVRDGETVWETAVGAADVAAVRESTPDTQYRIGSITKTFTAAAVMQLRDAGKLDLEDTLDRHIDGAAHRPTLRRLLSHTSGIQRETQDDAWLSLRFAPAEELVATLGDAEQVLPPGARFHYSNLAFALLGIVVERASGMPYADYVRTRLLEPLGLRRITFEPEEPAAVGYLVEEYVEGVAARRESRPAAGSPRARCGGRCATSAAGPRSSPRRTNRCSRARPSRRCARCRRSTTTCAGPAATGSGSVCGATASGSSPGTAASMPGFIAGGARLARGQGRSRGAHELERGRGRAARAGARRATVDTWPVAPAPWRVEAPPPDDVEPLLGIWWHGGRARSCSAGATGSSRAASTAFPSGARRPCTSARATISGAPSPARRTGRAAADRARRRRRGRAADLGRLPGHARAAPDGVAAAATRTAALRARSACPHAVPGRSLRRGRRRSPQRRRR